MLIRIISISLSYGYIVGVVIDIILISFWNESHRVMICMTLLQLYVFTCGGVSRAFHYNDVIMSTTASQITNCLLNLLFRRRSKKTSKLSVTGICERNSPVTGEFPSQRASNAENASIWWRHNAAAWRFFGLLWLCELISIFYAISSNNISWKSNFSKFEWNGSLSYQTGAWVSSTLL